MFKHVENQDFHMFGLKLKNYSFQALEVVGRGSETQLHVLEKNKIT